MTERAVNRFLTLEAGRGLAALMVVLHHAGNIVAQPRFYARVPFGGLLGNFNVGVDFFFVLSGFIITWVHWHDVGQSDRIGAYVRKRFLRVYPAYWGVLLPLIVLYQIVPSAGLSSQRDPLNVALSFVLLPNSVPPVLGVAWTLTFEVLFYILFALIIAFGPRAFAGLAIWAAAIVCGNILWTLTFPLNFLFSPLSLEFIMGVSAAALLRSRHIPAPRLVAVVGAATFVCLCLFARHLQDHQFGRMLFGLSAMLFVLGGVDWERNERIIVPRALIALGGASYVLYLVHPVALSFGIQILRRASGAMFPVELAVVILSLFALIIGFAYHLTAEPMLTRITRQLLDRRRMAAPREDISPRNGSL